jgi:hypothetical protein
LYFIQALANKIQVSEDGVRNGLLVSPADTQEYLNALYVFDRKRDLCQYCRRKDCFVFGRCFRRQIGNALRWLIRIRL